MAKASIAAPPHPEEVAAVNRAKILELRNKTGRTAADTATLVNLLADMILGKEGNS